MTFLELATERFSVRKFDGKPVEEDKIQKIIQAGKVAPTAVNFQPQKLYVLRSQQAMERLAAIRPIFGGTLGNQSRIQRGICRNMRFWERQTEC